MPDRVSIGRAQALYQSFEICRGVAERGTPSGATAAEVYVDIHKEFQRIEEAYRYAKRYLKYFLGSKSHQRVSIELAAEVLLPMVEEFDGLAYSSREKRYRGVNNLHEPGSARRFQNVYAWVDNPFWIIQAIERLSSSIRRIKATTVEEVRSQLF